MTVNLITRVFTSAVFLLQHIKVLTFLYEKWQKKNIYIYTHTCLLDVRYMERWKKLMIKINRGGGFTWKHKLYSDTFLCFFFRKLSYKEPSEAKKITSQPKLELSRHKHLSLSHFSPLILYGFIVYYWPDMKRAVTSPSQLQLVIFFFLREKLFFFFPFAFHYNTNRTIFK